MRREATAIKLRENLDEFLHQVQYRADSIVVTEGGEPVAALVDYALYERISRLHEVFVGLTDINVLTPTCSCRATTACSRWPTGSRS